jgi:hypothetical protein
LLLQHPLRIADLTAQLQSPWITFYDSDGEPLVGAKVRIYEPGTLTPLDVYDDEAATPSDVVSQPFITNAAGRIPRYFVTQKYRMTVHTSADVLIDDVDDQDPGLPSGFGVSATVQVEQGGTGATNAAAARTNLGAASSSSVTALQDTVTELQTQVATGLNESDEFGALAAEDTVTRALLASNFGVIVVQTQDATPYTTNASLSTAIPNDDTIPTISEGTQILTKAITPGSTSNKIRITVAGHGTPSGSNSQMIVALYRGNTCIFPFACGNNSVAQNIAFSYIDSPSSTSELTYSVRVGSHTGSVYMNGTASGRLFGGAAACTMRLEELETH